MTRAYTHCLFVQENVRAVCEFASESCLCGSLDVETCLNVEALCGEEGEEIKRERDKKQKIHTEKSCENR